jgi:hypothetical protein
MSEEDFLRLPSPQSLKVLQSNGMMDALVKGQRYMRWQTQDELTTRMAIVHSHHPPTSSCHDARRISENSEYSHVEVPKK